jgi:glyoxylase-like metal-dependent hydrolase (beta-lactamase superfamily II)
MELRGSPRRLYCFTYGWEPIPEVRSRKGGAEDRFLLEPVTGAAVVFDQGWALIDSGFNPELIRDRVQRAEHYVNPSYIGVIPPGDPLVDQVAAAGLAWSELAFCAMSHLHCDHSGGLRLLADGPPVVLQQREFDFAMNEATVEKAYFRTDYGRDDLNWRLIDGEHELAEGFRVVSTPGHTPGHMSFAIDLRVAGTVVLACDAADLRGNIEMVIPCGTTTSPALEDDAQRSIELLHEMDSQEGVSVWPGHDPDFWPTRRTPPSSHV